MTYLELCVAVRQECGIQGEGPTTTVGQKGILKRVVEWVRDADLFIQTLHPDWNFLWSEFTDNTTQGSDTLAKPNDFGQWDRESFGVARGTTDGRLLPYEDFANWRMNMNLKAEDAPYRVTIKPDQNLAFQAPADGTYEIYGNYWAVPTQLTDNAQVSVIPVRFHRAILAKAKMWFFEDIESTDQWKQAEKEYLEWLSELKSSQLPQQQEANQSSPGLMAARPV